MLQFFYLFRDPVLKKLHSLFAVGAICVKSFLLIIDVLISIYMKTNLEAF